MSLVRIKSSNDPLGILYIDPHEVVGLHVSDENRLNNQTVISLRNEVEYRLIMNIDEVAKIINDGCDL